MKPGQKRVCCVGAKGCTKWLLSCARVHASADGTASSVSSLSAGPAKIPQSTSTMTAFTPGFPSLLRQRNLRNDRKMQPLKAEADVVQNIYPTRNNKPAHGRRSGGGSRSKTTNNPEIQKADNGTKMCWHQMFTREGEREREG